MSNADGIQIPVTEDDQGEGIMEVWEDYAETYPERAKMEQESFGRLIEKMREKEEKECRKT
jgi:hypothetical protein